VGDWDVDVDVDVRVRASTLLQYILLLHSIDFLGIIDTILLAFNR